MSQLTASAVVREILTADLTLPADEVIKRAKAKGLKAPDATIRTTVHNIKSELRKKAARPAPAAARTTLAPAATPSAPATTAQAPTDLTAVLANVALVNAVVGACGGSEPARKAAEAVRRLWRSGCVPAPPGPGRRHPRTRRHELTAPGAPAAPFIPVAPPKPRPLPADHHLSACSRHPGLAPYPLGSGFGGAHMVGQIGLNGVAVYAYVVVDGAEVRVRVSADEWERLGLSPGQRVRLEQHGREESLFLLARAEHEPPVVWLRLVPLTARRAA